MNLLCLDVASGGISSAIFDAALNTGRLKEIAWNVEALSVEQIADCFKRVIAGLDLSTAGPIDAICIGSFLHSSVFLDREDQPLSPVFTWLDHRGESGVDYVRSRLGNRFHEITGCRYHPMFPVFKIAATRMNDSELFARVKHVVSVKALLQHWLTGTWTEDHGTASASGLFNVMQAAWDPDVLRVIGLEQTHLPPIVSRTEIIGQVTASAAAEFGLTAGATVVEGSGDGFLSNIGSDCEVPSRIAVSLGTSAVARQTLTTPVLVEAAGTFCYRADRATCLLGCAGSNGGNVLDWGRQILGAITETASSEDPPIFIPLLHGERSPDWNPHLTGSWHGVVARHTAADLSRSILEGVVFNLAHFVEILSSTSREKPAALVLSGNGFRHPLAAPILATVVGSGISTQILPDPGMATLRGAGICALRALAEPVPRIALTEVPPLGDRKVSERYGEYRRLRARHTQEM